MKTIVILGSNGFLAQSLIEEISSEVKFNIILISRVRSTSTQLEQIILSNYKNNFNIIKEIILKADYVINFIYSPNKNDYINKYFYKNLLLAIKNSKKNIHLIHLSSFSVYGFNYLNKKKILSEDFKLIPNYKYGLIKLNNELDLTSYHAHNYSYTVLRVGGVISVNRLPKIFKINKFILSLFLDKNSKFNLININVLINIIYQIMKNNTPFKNEIFNVSKCYSLEFFNIRISKNSSFVKITKYFLKLLNFSHIYQIIYNDITYDCSKINHKNNVKL